MKRTGELYIWPDPKDSAWVPTDDIVAVLEPPKLRNKREQFHFTNLELVQEKLKPNIVRFQ